jgi:pimeloyl-ACP methyl ester carboxylesterase
MIPGSEKYLNVPEGRTLAYTESGNTSSSTLVLFFHGVFGIGDASHPSLFLVQQDVHFVAPTLPGWGKSSPRNPATPYHIAVASDITALVQHLHPNDSNFKLYVAGGSYGTVIAQMLYGASFDAFPPGRYLAGCMVLAPFSPFSLHKEYSATMTMPNYIAVGPPSQWIPFRLLQRIFVLLIGRKFKTVDSAEVFIRSTLFDKMGEEELAAFKKWREENGRAEGEVERSMAENVVQSVRQTWAGFMEVSDVIHSDWGYDPNALDEEHKSRPILVVTSEGDALAPDAMAKWLCTRYANAHFRTVTGGHLAALFQMNDLWKELFTL